MAYMAVLEKTESHLRLLREPTFLSKAVFMGFSVGVTGVILFGSEPFLIKVVIGVGAIFLSCFLVDNYEICDMNKETSEVHLTRMHLCQYFLGSIFSPHPFVTSKLTDIQDVRIESQETGESKKSHRVILVLKSGIQLGLTEVFTNNEYSEHEKILETITSFLGVSKAPKDLDDDANYEGDGSSSDDNDKDHDVDFEDDFEQITKSDIELLEKEQDVAAGSGDITEECIDKLDRKEI